MARRAHVELALVWLQKTNQREGRNECEAHFRQWIKRQVDAGHTLEVVTACLAESIERELTPCWRFSRELLEDVGDLAPVPPQPEPVETPEQRKRRKAATAAFLGPRAVAVPNAFEDDLERMADEREAREAAEREQEDVDRLSEGERAELRGLLDRQRRGEEGRRG